MHRKLVEYQEKKMAASQHKHIMPSKKEKTYSAFFKEVYTLVKETEALLEPTRPWINGYLWEERKSQLKILKLSFESYHKSLLQYDDTSLFIDCFFLEKYSHTSWLPSIYNEFVDRLREILDMVSPDKISFSAYSNVQLMQNEIKKLEVQLDQHHIRETKLLFQKEIVANSTMQQLEEKLANVSGDEILAKLAITLKKQELGRIHEHITVVKKRQETMEDVVSNLVDTIGSHAQALEIFRKRYPQEYEKFSRIISEQQLAQKNVSTSDRKVMDTRGLTTLISNHSALYVNPAQKRNESTLEKPQDAFFTLTL